jgi:maleate isomerase
VAALKTLSIGKVALGTPYGDDLTGLCRSFLESEGFEVLNTIGLDNVNELRSSSVELAYQLARDVDSREADGVFISCTDFPTFEVIDILEADLGKPVVTANAASFWHSIRVLGIQSRFHGHGMLLDSH